MGIFSASLRLATLTCLVGLVGIASCTQQNLTVTVKHANGVDPRPAAGDPLKVQALKRDDVAHHKPGYFVLRNTDDWDLFFADPSIRPAGIDFSQQMVVAAYANDSTITELQIRSAGDTGDTVNVFVTQITPGDGCAERQDHLAYALAVVDKKSEPVQFYVDEERGNRCDIDPPSLKVSCRVPPDKQWSEKLTAPLGRTVECTAAMDMSQRRTIVDRDWSIREVPRGSDAKLSILDEAKKVSFVVDAIGTYQLRVAATDEAGRSGEVIAAVEAPPPTQDLWIELVWSNFSSSDDPDTFPRIELHANEVTGLPVPVLSAPSASASAKTPPKGPPPKGVLVQAQRKAPVKGCFIGFGDHTPWCEASKYGKNTVMHLKGAPGGRYDVNVHYTDDRFPGAPIACVRSYLGGKPAYELCDNHTRKADETWQVGVFDEATGKPEGLDAPPAAPSLDGGVASATLSTTATDGGK